MENETKNSLVGKFIHSFKKSPEAEKDFIIIDGQKWVVQYQGVIVDYLKEINCVSVLLFSWLNGDPTNEQIFSIEEIKKCNLYSSDYQMRQWYWCNYKKRPECFDEENGMYERRDIFFNNKKHGNKKPKNK